MKKSVISILSTLVGAAVGAGAIGKVERKTRAMSDKHLELFKMMTQWVQIKQEGKNLASYFEAHDYKKIAVYGMSYAGETLLNELKNSRITVAYGIDKNATSIYVDIDIVSPNDTLENVDAIVVTAVTFFDEIEEMLSEKIDCPIISLEDILYEI